MSVVKKVSYLFIALIVSTSSHAFVTPIIESIIDKANTIKVIVYNHTDKAMNCDWSIMYFVDGLNCKRKLGELAILPNSKGEVVVSNDPYSKLNNLRTRFECE